MLNWREKSVFLLGIFLIGFFCIQSARAATTGVVTATVTAQNISVNVTDGTISYGTLGQDSYTTTLTGGVNDQQTATNDGNVTEDFNIKGQNSANWTLDSVNTTTDHYVHEFCTGTCGTEATPTNFTALTTNYQTLATAVGTTSSQVFDLMLTTPQTSTVYTSQSVDVTVQAVAN